MVKKLTLNFILSLIGFAITAFGMSVAIKSVVGLSSVNAFNQSVSHAFNIKVGTVTAGLNIFFLILYAIITQFKYPVKYIVQLVATLQLGTIINFFTYTIFNKIDVVGYIPNLLFLVVGTSIACIAVSFILVLDTIAFPIEAYCLAVTKKYGHSFAIVRRTVDVFSLTVSLALTYFFSTPLVVREGTLLNIFLFSYLVDKFYKIFEKNKFIQKLK